MVNTGSELLLGQIQNTHGSWFGQELMKLGLRVERQTTVPDGDAIQEVLGESMQRADVLLVTGGLGPTSDDLTRESLSYVTGLELIEDELALRDLKAFFDARGSDMAPSNLKQAQAPVGSEILLNPNGTAPGIYLSPKASGDFQCAVFLLPGPPRELYPMFHEEVAPRLKALSGVEAFPVVREFRTVGVGESRLHDLIDAELNAIDGLEVGYCARIAEVDIRLIGLPDAVSQASTVVQRVIPEYIANHTAEDVAQTLVQTATEKGLTLALAESCTGGLIANRITNISGSSAVLTHGWVTYANEAKTGELDVCEQALADHGAVSAEVCEQMAIGALEASGSDVALAVTGIAGPGGGSEEKPVGTYFRAIATKKEGVVEVAHLRHVRDRLAFKQTVAQYALKRLIDLLR